MAEVYKVKTVGIAGFEKVQALKRILPHSAREGRFIRSFIDEARIAVELTHRNIVQVFDFGKADGELFLAMELIEGRDLRAAMAQATAQDLACPIPVAAYVISEAAAGLDYAHRKTDLYGSALGIVHCDVSPSNVMLSSEGDIKILDFGIARATFASALERRRLRGKPRYMAPEQTLGEPPTSAADVFALGIIAWELFTGLPLYRGADLKAILEAVRCTDPPRIDQLNPKVPREIVDAVATALAREPAARGTAADLLARVCAHGAARRRARPRGVAHRGSTRAARARSRCRRRAAIAAADAVARPPTTRAAAPQTMSYPRRRRSRSRRRHARVRIGGATAAPSGAAAAVRRPTSTAVRRSTRRPRRVTARRDRLDDRTGVSVRRSRSDEQRTVARAVSRAPQAQPRQRSRSDRHGDVGQVGPRRRRRPASRGSRTCWPPSRAGRSAADATRIASRRRRGRRTARSCSLPGSSLRHLLRFDDNEVWTHTRSAAAASATRSASARRSAWSSPMTPALGDMPIDEPIDDDLGALRDRRSGRAAAHGRGGRRAVGRPDRDAAADHACARRARLSARRRRARARTGGAGRRVRSRGRRRRRRRDRDGLGARCRPRSRASASGRSRSAQASRQGQRCGSVRATGVAMLGQSRRGRADPTQDAIDEARAPRERERRPSVRCSSVPPAATDQQRSTRCARCRRLAGSRAAAA